MTLFMVSPSNDSAVDSHDDSEITIRLRPDRIALYSFALVPWIKPAQRLFKDEDLPSGADKRNLYEISRTLLLDAGYQEIGMDHFGLGERWSGKKRAIRWPASEFYGLYR